MQQLLSLLTLDEDRQNIKRLILFILVAYLFSIAVRMVWVYHFSGQDNIMWNDQLMLNTNDGYLWAEGARDILNGQQQENDLSPVDSPPSKLTALLVSILPFSFETIILYMPAFLGSLIVIPIILIGRSLRQTRIGFIAALLGGIVWSYYNRTMVGYYDTDMLIIVLPTFVLWALVLGVTHNKNRYLLVTTFTVLIYQYWYPGSFSLNMGMAGILFFYAMVFDRKNIYNYKLLLFVVIAIVPIVTAAKVLISFLLYLFFHFSKEKSDKTVIPLFMVSIVVLLYMGGLDPVLKNLSNYVFRVETSTSSELSLHFFNVVQTVREAGNIPFETFANRISGHPITFLLSTIGVFLMMIRFPVMTLAIPMLGLGFLAFEGGLRFTVYAAPVNALGMAFLLMVMSKFFNQQLHRVMFLSLATVAVLYPNVKHIIDYKVPTVFAKQEVQVLDKLKSIATREDYVIAWWDYGYPIRYYADVKTLIDGGKHAGFTNYPVSYALTEEQKVSAIMARLEVEYVERAYKKGLGNNTFQYIMEDYGFNDPNIFLEKMKKKDFKLPEKTRDVFYYLPLRMLDIYPTVRLFSNLNLLTGKQYASPFFYQTNYYKESGESINLGKNIIIDKRNNTIRLGNQEVPLNTLYVTAYERSGKLTIKKQLFNMTAPISIVFMKSYNKFLVLDQQTLNSTYMQLFVFENYNSDIFEPVILDPLAKVYRLKK